MSDLPVLSRPWEVYLVHHSHVDIGYTDPQPIVMRKQAEHIAQALDYCTVSDHLPSGEQFAWTCEVSWTVKAFLARYPERAKEFFRRVREGRIEVTGLYLQLTDMFDESLLEYALQYATELARTHRFEVCTAMNNDVNGWAWGLPKLMADRGIRYFDTAINNVRALNVTPRPRPYYWAAPDGSRVLMWHGTSYLHGNALALHDPSKADRLYAYLAELEAEGYPHHAICIRVQGEVRDNAPPASWLSEAVQQWNAQHDHPQLHIGTSRQWFEHLEQEWPEDIHEWRTAWPDWWADGFGSMPYETTLVRTAQAELTAARAVSREGKVPLDPTRVAAVQEAASFFCEHTAGAWCSTDLPHILDTKATETLNLAFAYTAATEAKALLQDTLMAAAPRDITGPAVLVFNPLPWSRTDVVEVMLRDDALFPELEEYVVSRERTDAGPALHLVDEETGCLHPVSRHPHVHSATRYPAQMVTFVAHDLPPLGWRSYRVVLGKAPVPPVSRASGESLNSPFFQAVFDPVTGGIAHLSTCPDDRTLVAPGDYTLNQFIFEIIDSPRGREDLCYWGERHDDTPFRRTTPPAQLTIGPALPFGARMVTTSGGGDVPQLCSAYTLYDHIPRLDIVNTLMKYPRERAEAVYHAFPFVRSTPTVYLDIPGAVIRPGIDQVPGTATDWYALQRYFAVSDEEVTIIVASPDVPLVQINGITTGCWQETLPKANGLVMSWVMNNYWFTNWPAYQWGEMSYRYSISCLPGPFEAVSASRAAAELRQPALTHVIPAVAR